MTNLHDLSRIDPCHLTVGMHGTLWTGHSGQGGRVTSVHKDCTTPAGQNGPLMVVLLTPLGTHVTFTDPDFWIPQDAEDEQERFRTQAWRDWESGGDRQFDDFPNEAAELAYSMGWSKAVRYGTRPGQEDSLARYADSDVAPAWLDPDAIGERWDDD